MKIKQAAYYFLFFCLLASSSFSQEKLMPIASPDRVGKMFFQPRINFNEPPLNANIGFDLRKKFKISTSLSSLYYKGSKKMTIINPSIAGYNDNQYKGFGYKDYFSTTIDNSTNFSLNYLNNNYSSQDKFSIGDEIKTIRRGVFLPKCKIYF